MASSGAKVTVGICPKPPLHKPPNVGVELTGNGNFLTHPWKHPGEEYPHTPGLLGNLEEICDIVPLGNLRESSTKVSADNDRLLAKCEYELFKLQQPDGAKVPQERREKALEIARTYHDKVKSNFLGFQANMACSFSHLSHYLDTHVNNIGDPFATGSFLNQTKFMERAVLDYFAALWRADWPHDNYTQRKDPEDPNLMAKPQNPCSYWGFVLSMGCTEGTLYGMWNGRDYLAGKVMLIDEAPKGSTIKPEPRYFIADLAINTDSRQRSDAGASKTPLCFFSNDAHYSLKKTMVILNIKTYYDVATELGLKVPPEVATAEGQWPKQVPTNLDGTVNIDALAVLVEFFANLGYPALVCFNYGTTFKGAYDDIQGAANKLLPIFKKYNLLEVVRTYTDANGEKQEFARRGFWFHVDGALGAAYMPFLKMANANGMFQTDKPIPQFDFSMRGEEEFSDIELVFSIGMSGHKWIGAPVPTGVYMTKTKFQLKPPEKPEYIGTPDTTFAGSRSGLASVFLWDYLSRNSYNDLMVKAVYTEAIATKLFDKLVELDKKVVAGELHPNLPIAQSLWVQRSELSLGVIFRRPRDEIVEKYSLSKEEETKEDGLHLLVHAFAMEHVTYDRIDSLIVDLCQDDAFAVNDEAFSTLLHRFKLEW
ncbi:hypothetical protein MPTK1_5g24130 [Marchantia polymorpha subsp. ruderalis]|uniref:Glutamate decarboxylase n=2 Tax=Marchantia polymorpha TaxID=3197 RepID=A0AAF6BLQ4_MARPO|nr:hypothetical protein MARPO_0010s0043 [Marchantia polymorpha]BBN12938.1 hypothetical protein Mp_5g24130 [Marchantia polymorpha subsp. ruderalis]|eukprot:PTQ46633.1 hypothetical protein MARPO_0010s0043 [Marchantia polymorpha]